MTLENIFWAAVLIPLGLGLGLFLSAVFFGIDWGELIHGPSRDE